MIRRLELIDIPECEQVCQKCFAVEGYSYDVAKDFRSQYDGNTFNLEFYLFEEDGIIKGVGGLSNCGFDDGVYGLFTCFVAPEFQGKGVGKALTEYRIQRAKELGAEIIFSTTQKPWHLERFGFEVIKSPYKKRNLMQLNVL